MRPDAELVLRETARQLTEDVMPHIERPFDAQTIALAGYVISAVADHWDSAAALRHEENECLRVLLSRARGIVQDAQLKQDITLTLDSPEKGLRISELDGENDRLRALLLRVWTQVYLSDNAPEAELTAAIRLELANGAQRRAFKTQPV